jgi:hypothetical protein
MPGISPGVFRLKSQIPADGLAVQVEDDEVGLEEIEVTFGKIHRLTARAAG